MRTEPLEDLDRGGLAPAAAPDERGGLPRRNFQREALQHLHLRPARVVEPNLPELDAALELVGRLAVGALRVDRRAAVDQVEDALDGALGGVKTCEVGGGREESAAGLLATIAAVAQGAAEVVERRNRQRTPALPMFGKATATCECSRGATCQEDRCCKPGEESSCNVTAAARHAKAHAEEDHGEEALPRGGGAAARSGRGRGTRRRMAGQNRGRSCGAARSRLEDGAGVDLPGVDEAAAVPEGQGV